MLIWNRLKAHAVSQGEKLAKVCGDTRLTYAQFAAKAEALAHSWLQQGLQPGDRVALHRRNGIELATCYYACSAAGVVAGVEGAAGAGGGGLGPESLGGAGSGFGRFLFSILGRRGGFERMKQAGGDGGDFVDGREERGFIGLRRLVQAADFPDELQRGGVNFFLSDWRIEVEKRLDIPAPLTPR